jgi:hypothetical protein
MTEFCVYRESHEAEEKEYKIEEELAGIWPLDGNKVK